MDYEQEKQHFINEVLAFGRSMRAIGVTEGVEAVNGVQKAETSTLAGAQIYLNHRKIQEEQEQARVKYAIERLISMGIEHKQNQLAKKLKILVRHQHRTENGVKQVEKEFSIEFSEETKAFMLVTAIDRLGHDVAVRVSEDE